MKLSKTACTSLAKEKGLTQNQLSKEIGVSHGALSNALSGRRGAGRKVLSGLLRLFPTESVISLTEHKRQVGK